AVKAESDICFTSGNAVKVVESLGTDRVILIPDEHLAANIARDCDVEVITWPGRCEVHDRFTAADIAQVRADHEDVLVMAHPECPPEVVAASDISGSTAQMVAHVEREQPARVALITECSMSDNIAAELPEVEMVRPCNLCPHMKRNNLGNIRAALENLRHEVRIDPAVARRARAAVERMLEIRRAPGCRGCSPMTSCAPPSRKTSAEPVM